LAPELRRFHGRRLARPLTQRRKELIEHLLPRLTRFWSHLSRQKGGIGMRGGEGETQLESDRRRVQERIDKIKDVLKPGQEVTARVIKIDREQRRIGLSIKAANYSAEQLAQETATYDQFAKSSGAADLTNLGDIFDEASKKE